jgi:uncharacterized membrane protein YhfC
LSKIFPTSQLSLAKQQVAAYWSIPWGYSLLGALERFLTIPIQISMAVLVLQTFIRRQWFWVWLAVLYHAIIDTTAVAASAYVQGPWIEVFVGFFALLSIGLIFILRRPEPVEALELESPLAKPVFTPTGVDETEKNLENTRYD